MEGRDLVAIGLAGGKVTRVKSDLPKVMHDLSGRSVIQHCIDNVRRAGIGDVVVVVGYRRDLVTKHLADGVRFAVEELQLGTGHAVQQALSLIEDTAGAVFICYGDMPFLSTSTIRKLIEIGSQPCLAGAILTMVSDDPPDYGRVVRDEQGRVTRVIEVNDCAPEELKIREVNAGVYCFDAEALRWALPHLEAWNAQNEYQFTDTVQVLAEGGRRVETAQTAKLEETLGINDRTDLKLAQRDVGHVVGRP